MTSPLNPLHINNPGAAGVNLQDAEGIIEPQWATLTDQLLINRKGKLSTRPGIEMVGGPPEYVTTWRTGGYAFVYKNATDGIIYSQFDAISFHVYEHTPGTPGWSKYNIPAGTQSGLKAVRYNGKTILNTPAPSTAGTGVVSVQATPGNNYTAIVPTVGAVPPKAGVDILSAWGRLWLVDIDGILYWSALLDETDWGVGTANQIDLRTVWPAGEDTPVGLAEFNGYLVIFGSRSVIIYSSPDFITNIAKVEAIAGVGCINHKTIKQVGDDLVFLSEKGVVSLSRIIQEKSMPIRTLSDSVRDNLIELVHTEYNEWTISCGYSDTMNLYAIKVATTAYFFDTSMTLPDGTWRCVVMDCDKQNSAGKYNGLWLAHFHDDLGIEDQRGILISNASVSHIYGGISGAAVLRMRPGVVGDYIDTETPGTYTGVDQPGFTYSTGWLDFTDVGLQDAEKVLKELRLVVQGGNSVDVTLNVYGDYDETTAVATQTLTVPATGTINTLIFDIGGEAGVVKLKLTSGDATSEIVITRVSVYAKRGKLAQ